ncbi:exostosin domain-containing protein [Owenweeksia hongkongensis]|uniref:exostosin domain-containing protein n=1 Tax=Owenweeksia hongkongensis TaxID=253245 RepID=UPI003A9497B5
MISKTIFVDSEINFIQQLRLIHGLSESEFTIGVRAQDENKLKLLQKQFGMPYKIVEEGDIMMSNFTEVHHKHKVSTSVGSIQRTLVFPHSIVDYCKSIWPQQREYRYTFAGLITKNRGTIIKNWVAKNIDGKVSSLPNADSFWYKVRKKIFLMLDKDDSTYKKVGDLVIWSSTRGRKYPEKAWDDNYFRFMANSQFVLCPSGNSIWSYRFFEAILCGAIPIIEESCPEYEGFRYYKMSDDARKFKWSQENAEYNYKVCLDRITIDIKELNQELQLILSKEIAAKPA